jgi:hypothetical protein
MSAAHLLPPKEVSMHKLAMSIIAALLLATLVAGSGASDPASVRTLDGSGNNPGHADWGQAGTEYSRAAAANYGDGIGTMVSGPSPRYASIVAQLTWARTSSRRTTPRGGAGCGASSSATTSVSGTRRCPERPDAVRRSGSARGFQTSGVLGSARRLRRQALGTTNSANRSTRSQLHRRLERLWRL